MHPCYCCTQLDYKGVHKSYKSLCMSASLAKLPQLAEQVEGHNLRRAAYFEKGGDSLRRNLASRPSKLARTMDHAVGQAAVPSRRVQATFPNLGWERICTRRVRLVYQRHLCACTLHRAWQDAVGHTSAS